MADYFDLIVGTSTGGIDTLGLGYQLRATFTTLREPDRHLGGNRIVKSIRRFRVAKYSDRPLRNALETVFGERKLGESSKRLVIPSLNLDTGEVYINKTAHHSKFERDYKKKVVDVALATAAAPTFFPTHQSAVGTPLIDGGVYANNPTGLAAVEAIGVLNWPKGLLRVLSLGCTLEPFDAGSKILAPED